MPSGALARRLLLGTGLALLVLLVVGFIFGAVGSAMFGTDQLLDKPEIHLAPQPVFPASTRDKHLGLTPSATTTARPRITAEKPTLLL